MTHKNKTNIDPKYELQRPDNLAVKNLGLSYIFNKLTSERRISKTWPSRLLLGDDRVEDHMHDPVTQCMSQ